MEAHQKRVKNIANDIKTKALAKPTRVQLQYLQRGLGQPGGKLPLFDQNGQRFKEQTIRACLSKGWCEPWYNNPLKPDWLVCKLTLAGREIANQH